MLVLFAPGGDVPVAPPGVDKAVHVALFLALALTGRWAGIGVLPVVVLATGYAVASELVQASAPLQRSGSAGDVLADLVGAALGVLAWAVVQRRRTRRPGG